MGRAVMDARSRVDMLPSRLAVDVDRKRHHLQRKQSADVMDGSPETQGRDGILIAAFL